MTINGIMSRDVVTVSPATALMEIRKRLYEGGFHHLLVVEDGDLLGVISDRDVLRALSPFLDTYSEEHRDVQTLAQPASEVMRTDPVTVRPDTEIEDGARLLLDHNISSLPVVRNGDLVGIVTTKDLLSYYADGK
ncbi:MAG: CBS domain-containing protein [Salinibacter sp.]